MIVSDTLAQRFPLLSVDTAAYLLAQSADAVRNEMETGKLCAWDFRSKAARNRGCVRILALSLNRPVEESQIYFWVPAWNPTAAQLTRLLNVSQWLVAALIQDGELQQIGKPGGPKLSPRVCRQSLLKFLKSRRVGCPEATLRFAEKNSPTLRSPALGLKTRQTKSAHGLHTGCVSLLKLAKPKK